MRTKRPEDVGMTIEEHAENLEIEAMEFTGSSRRDARLIQEQEKQIADLKALVGILLFNGLYERFSEEVTLCRSCKIRIRQRGRTKHLNYCVFTDLFRRIEEALK